MDVRPLTDQLALRRLIDEQPLNPFLQSWAWGEFQQSLGRRITRLGVFEGPRLTGAALLIEHQLLLGKSYWYCPRGPLATSATVFSRLLEAIAEHGRHRQTMYVKIDPGLTAWPWSALKLPAGSQPGTTLQPGQTVVIDTAQTPGQLLAACHQKTRYNIRLAEKHGVAVRWSVDAGDFNLFLGLMHQTYDRQGIRLHGDAYYRQQFSALLKAQMAELVLAEYQGQAIVANMVIWHGRTATYLHGGSSDEHKEVMAPHLTQWRTIERAHQRGVTAYDLWGVAPAGEENHRWGGVSRFKRGFPGREVEFPPAINLILQPQWYQTYRWAKRFRGGVDE